MNEISVRTILSQVLSRYGYEPKTWPDAIKCNNCGHVVVPEIGRPDSWLMNPTGLSAYMEVKALKLDGAVWSLSFNTIRAEQREWMSSWRGLGYLGLGVIASRELTGKKVDRLEALYLVDWQDWLRIESLVTPYQNSIPYKVRKGMLKPVQTGNLCIANLCKRWQLVKERHGWSLPDKHTAIQ